MRKALLLSVALLFVGGSPVNANQDASSPIVGGDVDEHGCRGSAGYAWCARTGQCERPWELAQSKAFDVSDEAFSSFCEGEDGFWLLQWCVAVDFARCERTDRCESVKELAADRGFEPTPRAFNEFCRR